MKINLANYFEFTQNNTTWHTEFIAGLTTFLTMSYVVIVYPAMMNSVGIDGKSVFVATCLAAAFGSILMGTIAKYPVALAPSMGLAAYFTFGIINKMAIPWPIALGIVFISGILFLILALTKIRQHIITAIPLSIKIAIAAGMGLFLAAIALKNIGILVLTNHISLAPHIIFNAPCWLCLLAIIIMTLLDFYEIKGAILIGIIATTLLGIILHITPFNGIFSFPPHIHTTFLALQLPVQINHHFIIAIFTFFIVALFDNTGTLIGVLHLGKLIPPDGQIKRLPSVFIADSIATIFGSLLGTSSVGSYIESASGVRAGGRTGVTAIVVGILFLFTLFFQPLAASIPTYATAAALLYIATLMLRPMKYADWKNISEYVPALITVLAIPITFSLAVGIGIGLLSYVILNLSMRKINKLNISLLLLTTIFAIYLCLPN